MKGAYILLVLLFFTGCVSDIYAPEIGISSTIPVNSSNIKLFFTCYDNQDTTMDYVAKVNGNIIAQDICINGTETYFPVTFSPGQNIMTIDIFVTDSSGNTGHSDITLNLLDIIEPWIANVRVENMAGTNQVEVQLGPTPICIDYSKAIVYSDYSEALEYYIATNHTIIHNDGNASGSDDYGEYRGLFLAKENISHIFIDLRCRSNTMRIWSVINETDSRYNTTIEWWPNINISVNWIS